MKILYICPWPIPHKDYSPTEYPNSSFGYYTLKGKGVDITWYSHNRNALLYRLLRKTPQVNQIFTQIGCSRVANNYDVVYCGFDMHLLLLAILRALRIIRVPIFVLSHFSYNTRYTESIVKKWYKKIERWFVYRYIDKISFASESLLNVAMKDYNVPMEHCNISNWGAVINYYKSDIYKHEPALDYFLAAGGMNRDYTTLISAFCEMPDANLKVFAKYKDYTQGRALPDNVQFYNLMKENTYKEAFKKLREYYYNCIAILLPIDYINDVPNGATVLVEALAMGKPIIITEADTNYIDVEKEGVGLAVKRKDVNGWVGAIRFLIDNPQKVKEMGERAYQLAMNVYNDELFSENILNQMTSLVSSKKRS